MTNDRLSELIIYIAATYSTFVAAVSNKNTREQAEKDREDLVELLLSMMFDKQDFVQEFIKENKGNGLSTKQISDGHHTFEELYYHRMVLFSIIINTYKDISWKSKLHDDGTMFDDMFIVGITTPDGEYTYHYHIEDYDKFKVKELPRAPKYDGHKPEDITRLLSIIKGE